MKWFQNEPIKPVCPEHIVESAKARISATRRRDTSWAAGTLESRDDFPALVEPRLRAEAVEHLRQVEQWRAQRDEWSKSQPYDADPTSDRVRLWGGPFLTGRSEIAIAYIALTDAGADEATLRREASIVYELDRMQSVLDAKEAEAEERMRAEAERLAPPRPKRSIGRDVRWDRYVEVDGTAFRARLDGYLWALPQAVREFRDVDDAKAWIAEEQAKCGADVNEKPAPRRTSQTIGARTLYPVGMALTGDAYGLFKHRELHYDGDDKVAQEWQLIESGLGWRRVR
jgi:hypothetical protein